MLTFMLSPQLGAFSGLQNLTVNLLADCSDLEEIVDTWN